MVIPLIKICGVQDIKIAQAAVKLGAQLIGLIFHPHSKRHVNIDQAREISKAVEFENAIPVAVFVDQIADEMQEILIATQINCIQLHGENARRQHHFLSERYQRIYVQMVSEDGQIHEDEAAGLQYCDPQRDFLLFDGIYPGTGQSFAWHNFYYKGNFRLALAGGLKASNVRQAIEMLHPAVVDVSSGVENKQGKKELGLIQNFIRSVRKGK